jgi:hypothetical protein
MHKLVKIWLSQAEGRTDLIQAPATVRTWMAAQGYLQRVAKQAQASGSQGGFKTDFEVTWSNGSKWGGTALPGYPGEVYLNSRILNWVKAHGTEGEKLQFKPSTLQFQD